jgi:fibronectin type 3 domain-containing protein
MREFSTRNYFYNINQMTLKGDGMKKLVRKTFAAITVLSIMTLGLVLAGCGGGSGGVSSEVVSGTAAVGAPLSGQVNLKDSATPPELRTSGIGPDGSFAINVTGMKAPFVLQAIGRANDTDYKLHSFANGKGTANINPLTDVIVASASGDDDSSHSFDKADYDHNHKIKDNIEKTVSTLLHKLQPLLKHYNAENSHPITSRYIANHLGMDDMFDHVKITVTAGILSIINEKTNAVIFSGKISDIANGIFEDGALPPTADAPVAPTGLTSVGGAGQVTLTWTSVSNATSYNLYFATTSGVTVTSGTKIASITTPYIQTGLAAGTNYYYVVTAVNSTGESSASVQTSASTATTPPLPTVPVAPTDVIATGGTNQVSLTWGTVSSATSYNLYYATTSGVTKTNGTKLTNVNSPAVQPELPAGTAYYYIVTAVNSTGESAASIQVAATTLATIPSPTAPAAPTGVTAVGSTNQATISWPVVSGAASYNVYWSTTTGVTKSSGTKVAGVTSPYVKTGLSAGTTHYFIVTAINSVGESAASVQATATTAAAPPAVPAAPTGVSATGGANQVSISWPAVSGATSYNIYWATTTGVTTSGTKITSATSPYAQTGLAASTTYYYIVTAVNAAGQSVASAQFTAATDAPVVTIPTAPVGVTATGGANQVSISWSAVSGATSYNIYYATTTGVTKTSGAKITNAENPYVQTGLAVGTTYYYIVTALNSSGESAASPQDSAATNAAPPATSCTTCHAIPPAVGSHSAHRSESCATCHGTGYSSTTVNAATHMNGIKNVSISVWNATTGSCATYCHASRSW